MPHIPFLSRDAQLSLATLAIIGMTQISETAKSSTLMGFLNGNCIEVKMPNLSSATSCSKAINVIHSTGRSGFYFVLANDMVITFSGAGSRNERGGNTDTQLVDLILVNKGGANASRPDEVKAKGACTFSNPFRGIPTNIKCTAQTELGLFQISFAHDGSAPTITEIP
jgi:hypothetical protein